MTETLTRPDYKALSADANRLADALLDLHQDTSEALGEDDYPDPKAVANSLEGFCGAVRPLCRAIPITYTPWELSAAISLLDCAYAAAEKDLDATTLALAPAARLLRETARRLADMGIF